MSKTYHAPPSPSPTPVASPSVSVSPSPTVLPKTGMDGGDIAWTVFAAIALVVVGMALMGIVARSRRANVH